ncbi:RagB/SusD family nutrient uptake outer membrane protein [Maribellus comscasis]|uniref:RagB/SusD family nutrient uptake outer membrane protein n=1 Tax=Maribellus comscasis TaxID=2681766 RepID=A0A6I6JRZ7_9BACT|nr:RagB/SusD family nutrient uptake outer membrane protein [Maribellus comscasis]QGY45211.1 RagB/SusD family nutrient uptake outer membrane protein [Maribellus comscasis]
MKSNNKYFRRISTDKILSAVILFLFLAIIHFSCNEDEFLKTEPVDFYSPENSYITSNDYEAAVMNLYARVRDNFFSSASAGDFPNAGFQATDIFHIHKDMGFDTDLASILLPTNDALVYDALWEPAYRIIYDANAIIERSASDDNELTAEEKVYFASEAKFFRGYMYKMLANLYGNVPITLEETKSPKRDYVTSPREEVYQQAATDLKNAADNLENIDEVADYRISNLVALHMLSEVYISLEKWQDAVDAASSVIDHPSTALMTERFGARKDEKAWVTQGEFDTDVYWDLFRQGNQNRSTGNTEAIWVLEYEYNIPGGGDGYGGPYLERLLAPRAWQAKIENNDGSTSTLVPNPNAYAAGRSSGFLRPTHYFYETLWEKSGYEQDLRNSMANIFRDFIVRNPASDHNGKWLFKDNLPIRMASLNDTTRNMYPWLTKTSTPGKQPAEAFLQDPVVEGGLSWSHVAFRDVYGIRLSETYLLRAEAYFGMSETQKAADDINTVRNRAQAPLIDAGDVDIDYILDERARELYAEEFRVLTLARLGKLVERTKKYNPVNGPSYNDYNNLWPIPYSEIEKNLEGDLQQNPGY